MAHSVRTSQPKRSSLPQHHARAHKASNIFSVHLPDELVDVAFPVAEVSALDEVLELACPPATSGVRELEGPEEVRRLSTDISLIIATVLAVV